MIDARRSRPTSTRRTPNPTQTQWGATRRVAEYVATIAPATCDSCDSVLRPRSPHTRYAMKVRVSDTDVSTLTVRPKRSVSGGSLLVERRRRGANNREQPSPNCHDPHEVAHERRHCGMTANELIVRPKSMRTIGQKTLGDAHGHEQATTTTTGTQVRRTASDDSDPSRERCRNAGLPIPRSRRAASMRRERP
jgi:hypothetical protein